MLRELPVLPEQIEAFCRRHHVRQLSLFGSYLRADFNPNSDIDVLVEFEKDAQIGFLELARMQRELSELFQRDVDIVPASGLKPLIREDILDQSEVIFPTNASFYVIPTTAGRRNLAQRALR